MAAPPAASVRMTEPRRPLGSHLVHSPLVLAPQRRCRDGGADAGDADTGCGDGVQRRGVFGEKLASEPLAWPPSSLIFPLGLCSILVPWLLRRSDVFVLLQSLFLCEMQNPHAPDSLGEFRERKRIVRCFVRICSDPRRPPILGSAIRFLPALCWEILQSF